MGAGASAQHKSWATQILAAESRQQKLEVMAKLTRAIRNASVTKEDHAASKLQAMQRGKNTRNPVKGGMDLKAVFSMFANYGKSSHQKGPGDMIESSKFRKMMKNSNFICKGMTIKKKDKGRKINGNMCDQEFAEYCQKGKFSTKKKLHYNDFIAVGVPQLAVLLTGGDKEEFCQLLASNGKPKAASGGTKAEYTKFYDDKSTWTGVATRGGPSTTGDQITLSGMMNRKEAGVRGV